MKPRSLPLVLPSLVLLATAGAAQTVRSSVDSSGIGGDFTDWSSDLSADGRYVVFSSSSKNLVPGDTNFSRDVFVHDHETGTTERISVSSTGAQSDHHSDDPSISADGRYVAFSSRATNLVGDDHNGWEDIFLHDRATGATTRVNLAPGGEDGNGHCTDPVLTPDGRYVVFTSGATNLAPNSAVYGIVLRDLLTGANEQIAVDMAGGPADGNSRFPRLSADGRYVVFSSIATDLVPGDTNHAEDLFLRDRVAGTTTRVSVTSDGAQTSGPGGAQTLSGDVSDDGRWIVFSADAGDVVPDDTNGYTDVFLHDRQTGETSRLSVAADGSQGGFPSNSPSITGDGRYVVFSTWASNILPGDTAPWRDIALRDLWTGTLERISVDLTGSDPDNHSFEPAITDDGRFVSFESSASDLVPAGVDGPLDVFRTGPLAHDPAPMLAVNGSGDPLEVPAGTPLTVTIALDAGDFAGAAYDWWVQVETAAGDVWLLANLTWVVSAVPLPLYQGAVFSFPAVPIATNALVPPGDYVVRFALDAPDGVFQGTLQDTVQMTVF